MAGLAGLEVGDPRDGAAYVEAVAQQRMRFAVALHRAVLRRERRRVGILRKISLPWGPLLDARLQGTGCITGFRGRPTSPADGAQAHVRRTDKAARQHDDADPY